MTDELAALRDAVRVLTERVDALDALPQTGQTIIGSAADGDGFWALSGLQSRLADAPSTAAGAVMLVGSLTLPTGAPVSWQQSVGTAGMLETEWADQSSVFAALGHPIRMELLRHILCGVHATADLAAIEALGTTGQLHHHLRQLLSAGWVRQSGRGNYEIPAARIVPLLTCLLGAER